MPLLDDEGAIDSANKHYRVTGHVEADRMKPSGVLDDVLKYATITNAPFSRTMPILAGVRNNVQDIDFDWPEQAGNCSLIECQPEHIGTSGQKGHQWDTLALATGLVCDVLGSGGSN